MPRRLVYPLQFVKTLPPPEPWDRRPLLKLLHPRDPVTGDKERERIEQWYRELKSGEKIHLKHRLRSIQFREFWSAYYELMTARVARGVGAPSVRHAAPLRNRRPDFTVTFPSGTQIWEVAAAYQTLEREADDDKAHDLANRLNHKFQHRWRVVVEASTSAQGQCHCRKRGPLSRPGWIGWITAAPFESGSGPRSLTASCRLELTRHTRVTKLALLFRH